MYHFGIWHIIEKKGFIGRKACDMYMDRDSGSVDFIISSLMFGAMEESCEIKDFFWNWLKQTAWRINIKIII